MRILGQGHLEPALVTSVVACELDNVMSNKKIETFGTSDTMPYVGGAWIIWRRRYDPWWVFRGLRGLQSRLEVIVGPNVILKCIANLLSLHPCSNPVSHFITQVLYSM